MEGQIRDKGTKELISHIFSFEEDEECFKWSITIALNYQDDQKNLFRITKELRKQAEKLNWRVFQLV